MPSECRDGRVARWSQRQWSGSSERTSELHRVPGCMSGAGMGSLRDGVSARAYSRQHAPTRCLCRWDSHCIVHAEFSHLSSCRCLAVLPNADISTFESPHAPAHASRTARVGSLRPLRSDIPVATVWLWLLTWQSPGSAAAISKRRKYVRTTSTARQGLFAGQTNPVSLSCLRPVVCLSCGHSLQPVLIDKFPVAQKRLRKRNEVLAFG